MFRSIVIEIITENRDWRISLKISVNGILWAMPYRQKEINARIKWRNEWQSDRTNRLVHRSNITSWADGLFESWHLLRNTFQNPLAGRAQKRNETQQHKFNYTSTLVDVRSVHQRQTDIWFSGKLSDVTQPNGRLHWMQFRGRRSVTHCGLAPEWGSPVTRSTSIVQDIITCLAKHKFSTVLNSKGNSSPEMHFVNELVKLARRTAVMFRNEMNSRLTFEIMLELCLTNRNESSWKYRNVC